MKYSEKMRHFNYTFSLSGQQAIKGLLELTISKAGLDMVTKQFALEFGPHKIRVNSASLWAVLTKTLEEVLEQSPELKEKATSLTPRGKLLEVNDVIGPILYLLSDHSSMVTGTLHTVDGGLMCHIPV